MRRLALIMALLCLALAGCASQQRNDLLTNTLNAYQSAVRWGGMERASAFIDPVELDKHPISDIDMARYKQVRVSEYDAGAGPVPVSEFEVRQTVRIGLINVHTQSERSIIDQQTWRYDEASKHWWLTSGLPDITRD